MTDCVIAPPPSDLPPPLLEELATLETALHRGRLAPDAAVSIAKALEDLPPNLLSAVERQFRFAKLNRHGEPVPTGLSWLPYSTYDRSATLAALDEAPGLELVFLFNNDGHVREWALEKLQTTTSPFVLAAVALRTNDWVGAVQRAAYRCAERTFGSAPPDAVATAFLAIAERMTQWRRGEADRTLDRLFTKPATIGGVARLILAMEAGIGVRVLRHSLMGGAFDDRLLEFARDARNPAVRALAWQVLIDGEVRRRVWYDLEYDGWPPRVVRRIPRFERRPFHRPIPLDEALDMAARDRSAAVRRIAADGLTKHRHTLQDPTQLVARLAADRSPAVRQRAEWVAADLGLELPASTPE